MGSFDEKEKNCKQVYYELIAPFELQKYCYMFRLLSVAIVREQQYWKTHAALLRGLSIVNGEK
jgi:hypothetical protein